MPWYPRIKLLNHFNEMLMFPFLIVEGEREQNYITANEIGFQFKEKAVVLNKSNSSWEPK